MAIVVTDNCRDCRFTECVDVCPVSCFHMGVDMVYVDPQVCIECRACIPACPVTAIYDADDLPQDMLHWIAVNSARVRETPVISRKIPPLPKAEEKRTQLRGGA